eukprot:CAMPEP_0179094538 /NCGR_PEP_ID=MMETSP0796-20121207/43362_1 /TAXON_ID=73915 /ORGANISM="Pyrodinium bahamense, Strain pbaha01" /LENGTH=354 /DNA_ID=CAMNT_0020792213 /DNA_START=53 /DNA_END=1113 /DNA_ORIENTATION=-
MATWEKVSCESPIASLTRAIEEKDEELRSWRVRCLQAEAEVRALKKGKCHADLNKGCAGLVVEASPVPTGVREIGVQKDAGDNACLAGPETPPARPPPALLRQAPDVHEKLPVPFRGFLEATKLVERASEAEEVERLREELRALQAEQEAQAQPGREELEELQQALKQKSFAIIQLQTDMMREQKQLEKQRKAAESQNVFCMEELREMTQRAESLSEQVKKSKRKANELQQARDEAARFRTEAEESEARLGSELSAAEALRRARDELALELRGSRAEAVQRAELRDVGGGERAAGPVREGLGGQPFQVPPRPAAPRAIGGGAASAAGSAFGAAAMAGAALGAPWRQEEEMRGSG